MLVRVVAQTAGCLYESEGPFVASSESLGVLISAWDALNDKQPGLASSTVCPRRLEADVGRTTRRNRCALHGPKQP